MADTTITRATLGHDVHANQVIGPNYSKGVVALGDTDNHALVVDGRGKGRLTVHVVNKTNQDVVVTVYGAYASDDDPADANVIEIGGSGVSQFTASAGGQNYDCFDDPFPFYIVRITAAVTPDGSDVTIYTNLQSA